MAGSSITGSIAGTQVAVNASSSLQQGIASQILSSAAATPGIVFKTASGMLSGNTAIVSGSNSLVSGATSVPSASVLLTGQMDMFVNNGTTLATVVAADNTNSTIVNSNPQGALIGVTGAGANVLVGLTRANQFITGTGGQDAVVLKGGHNELTSNGSDAVLVAGPSTVSAAAGGLDSIAVTAKTTLSFINGSATSAYDSITGAANASVVVAGTGNTSITSGLGIESFSVDTSAGNVTLNANHNAHDVFTFIKDVDTGTNQTTVTNFVVGDTVLLNGYAGFSVTSMAGTPSGSVLSLSDGSQVTFNNATAAMVRAAIKPT